MARGLRGVPARRCLLAAGLVGMLAAGCTDGGGGAADVATLEDEADRLVEVVEQAAGATDGAGSRTVRQDRRRGPCDPGRRSVDQPMGTSVVHAVEVTDLDPSTLDDLLRRVADAWGVEVRNRDLGADGGVVYVTAGEVTASASTDKVLGRLSVSGETGCHTEA